MSGPTRRLPVKLKYEWQRTEQASKQSKKEAATRQQKPAAKGRKKEEGERRGSVGAEAKSPKSDPPF
jgi:hypothetical protein